MMQAPARRDALDVLLEIRSRELAEQERNRCLKIARGRARAGAEDCARGYYALAARFAQPTARQLRSFEDAISAGRHGVIIPGQLDLDGRQHGRV